MRPCVARRPGLQVSLHRPVEQKPGREALVQLCVGRKAGGEPSGHLCVGPRPGLEALAHFTSDAKPAREPPSSSLRQPRVRQSPFLSDSRYTKAFGSGCRRPLDRFGPWQGCLARSTCRTSAWDRAPWGAVCAPCEKFTLAGPSHPPPAVPPPRRRRALVVPHPATARIRGAAYRTRQRSSCRACR